MILDFKDEEIIGVRDNPTNLKQDFYGMLKKSKGKIVVMINGTDRAEYLNKNRVTIPLDIIFEEDEVLLVCLSRTYYISSANTAYVDEE